METVQLEGTTKEVFELLGFLGTASPSQLANRLQHSVQNASVILKSLEESGLVKCITPEKHTWKRYALSKQGLEKFSQSKLLPVSSFTDKRNMLEFDRLISDLVNRNNITRGLVDSSIRICFDLLREKCSTGLIIGDILSKGAHFSSKLRPKRIFLNEAKRFLSRHSGIVDGYTFACNFDSEGMLDGIIRLKSKEECNPLLWVDEQPYACLTSGNGVLAMRVCPDRRTLSIYAEREKIALFRDGIFSLNVTENLRKTIVDLSMKHGMELGMLERLCKAALHMSERQNGALFVIGDADAILKRSEFPSYEDLLLSNTSLRSLDDEEIVTLARQDGAVILDERGWIHGFGVILRPEISTTSKIFLNKGSRHLAAAKIAQETKSIAIVVSGDGPVSIVDEDEIAMRLDM